MQIFKGAKTLLALVLISIPSLAAVSVADCGANHGDHAKAKCECHDKKDCEGQKDCSCEACKEKSCGSHEGSETKHESCGEHHEHHEHKEK